jgi:hypothetical protein
MRKKAKKEPKQRERENSDGSGSLLSLGFLVQFQRFFFFGRLKAVSLYFEWRGNGRVAKN